MLNGVTGSGRLGESISAVWCKGTPLTYLALFLGTHKIFPPRSQLFVSPSALICKKLKKTKKKKKSRLDSLGVEITLAKIIASFSFQGIISSSKG